MINRRKESRFVEKNEVLIMSASDNAEGPVVNAYTYDISTGGARIFSKQFRNVGEVIKLQVNLARTRQSIVLPAEVKWFKIKEDERVFELGVEFRHQIATTLLALIRHLYSPDEGIPSSLA
jgi:hypothetical protein